MKQPRETILIRGARVYDHDGDRDMPAEADVLIADGLIARIEPGIAQEGAAGSPDRVIDARGKLLLPGFFNAHYHSHDTLLKGAFESPTLDYWGLTAMPPAYGRRSAAELRARTLVGAVECIRTGMTTIQDMDTINPFRDEDLDVVLDAYEEIGLRCVFAPQFGNVARAKTRPFYAELIPEAEQWRLGASVRTFSAGDDIAAILEEAIAARRDKFSLVDFALGPSSPESCSFALWEKLIDLSRREKLPIYTHLYENKGMTLIARQNWADHKGSLIHWLGDIGGLGPLITFAHSVWLRRDEIERLAETGANVALNPVGNLKTRSGVALMRELLQAGVNIGIGCDNCSCSDVQNMFQSMKLFTLLQGVCHPEEGPPYAGDALKAATLGGARTAGRTDIGALKPGMKADLVILDLTDISYVPLNSVARQVVYTESGRAVETVIVDGRLVMLDRKILTIDEEALRREVVQVMPELRRDLDAIVERLKPIRGHILEAERRTWETDIGVDRFVSPRF